MTKSEYEIRQNLDVIRIILSQAGQLLGQQSGEVELALSSLSIEKERLEKLLEEYCHGS